MSTPLDLNHFLIISLQILFTNCIIPLKLIRSKYISVHKPITAGDLGFNEDKLCQHATEKSAVKSVAILPQLYEALVMFLLKLEML